MALSDIDIERIRADAMAGAEAGRIAAEEARRMTEALRPQIEALRASRPNACATSATATKDACDVEIVVE